MIHVFKNDAAQQPAANTAPKDTNTAHENP